MNRQNRYLTLLSMLVLVMAMSACSLNRQLPEALDAEAMEAEVRAAIMAVAPGTTMQVDVTEGGRVTLEGHADNAAQRDAIVERVRAVNGVTSVNASGVHIE